MTGLVILWLLSKEFGVVASFSVWYESVVICGSDIVSIRQICAVSLPNIGDLCPPRRPKILYLEVYKLFFHIIMLQSSFSLYNRV